MHPIYCECRDKFTSVCFLGATEFLLRLFLFSLWKFFFLICTSSCSCSRDHASDKQKFVSRTRFESPWSGHMYTSYWFIYSFFLQFVRGVKLYGWSRLKRIAYVVFLGTYKCVKLIFVAVLTIGIWGVHGKFAGTFNMCLSRLLAYAQPYPPPPPFYLGGGREWIPVGYGFFGKGWRKPIQTNCPSCHGKYFILHWNRFSLIFATGLNSYLGFSLTQAPSINYFVIYSHFFH